MEMMPVGPYGLKGVRVTSNGRCYYDLAEKTRLVEACLEPGVSVARLALQHGANANQLRRWVMKRGQRSAGHRHAQRLGEQQLKLVGADPVPPARHRRSIEWQLVPEVLLAAEKLVIRMLHPAGADRLVRQTFHVLEQMHSRHQPGRQARAALLVMEPAVHRFTQPNRCAETRAYEKLAIPTTLVQKIGST